MSIKGRNILVVDDEPDLLDILKDELEYHGAVVTLASSGNQAFEHIKKTHFDMVISDVRMPDGDGVDLLLRVRALDPRLPIVIFVTGFSEIGETDLIAKGAFKLLRKPIDWEELTRILENEFK